MDYSQEKEMIEIEKYEEIVKYFEEEDDQDNRELFRDKHLANLMFQLKQDPTTRNIVKNSIVIMNVLIDDDKPGDSIDKIGTTIKELPSKEVEILKKKLKKLVEV